MLEDLIIVVLGHWCPLRAHAIMESLSIIAIPEPLSGWPLRNPLLMRPQPRLIPGMIMDPGCEGVGVQTLGRQCSNNLS